MAKKKKKLSSLIKKYNNSTRLFRIDTNVGRCYTPDPMNEQAWKPSVTTLENVISKGAIFEKWIANFGGYDKVSEYVGRKADDGTLVHEYIEQLIKGDVISLPLDTPEHIKKFILSFIEWWDNTEIIPVGTEIQLYHDDINFSGTADFICYIEGKLCMIDFKTGNEYPTTHQIQLSCYKELFDRIFPEDTIDHIYCLYVKSGWRKKPTFKLREYKYDSTISGALNYLWMFNNRANKTKIISKTENQLPNKYAIERKK